MVVPQEVREITNELQKKVDQIEENRMKDTEETKKYRDQTNEKNREAGRTNWRNGQEDDSLETGARRLQKTFKRCKN
jgi:hypothetical protein